LIVPQRYPRGAHERTISTASGHVLPFTVTTTRTVIFYNFATAIRIVFKGVTVGQQPFEILGIPKPGSLWSKQTSRGLHIPAMGPFGDEPDDPAIRQSAANIVVRN
jgi:hypothetical protein